MSGMDFEYAIKKDVRNNPIVREVDAARQRQLWRSAGIGLFLVVVLLFSAWQHFELLRHGYQIERMQQERAAEEEINRHLTLEVETDGSIEPGSASSMRGLRARMAVRCSSMSRAADIMRTLAA